MTPFSYTGKCAREQPRSVLDMVHGHAPLAPNFASRSNQGGEWWPAAEPDAEVDWHKGKATRQRKFQPQNQVKDASRDPVHVSFFTNLSGRQQIIKGSSKTASNQIHARRNPPPIGSFVLAQKDPEPSSTDKITGEHTLRHQHNRSGWIQEKEPIPTPRLLQDAASTAVSLDRNACSSLTSPPTRTSFASHPPPVTLCHLGREGESMVKMLTSMAVEEPLARRAVLATGFVFVI